jgi:hypothetical protein
MFKQENIAYTHNCSFSFQIRVGQMQFFALEPFILKRDKRFPSLEVISVFENTVALQYSVDIVDYLVPTGY